MQAYFAATTIVLLMGLVVSRVIMLRKRGIAAMQFGKIDRTDFLIPPFMLFYFYLIFANAFDLPTVSRGVLFQSGGLAWAGVGFCLAGLVFLAWSLKNNRQRPEA